jgi:hypothetical protein
VHQQPYLTEMRGEIRIGKHNDLIRMARANRFRHSVGHRAALLAFTRVLHRVRHFVAVLDCIGQVQDANAIPEAFFVCDRLRDTAAAFGTAVVDKDEFP